MRALVRQLEMFYLICRVWKQHSHNPEPIIQHIFRGGVCGGLLLDNLFYWVYELIVNLADDNKEWTVCSKNVWLYIQNNACMC